MNFWSCQAAVDVCGEAWVHPGLDFVIPPQNAGHTSEELKSYMP